MHQLAQCVLGLSLGSGVACGASLLGTAQKATEITFTAAEAACLASHANEGPQAARTSCTIEDERAAGVEVVVVAAPACGATVVQLVDAGPPPAELVPVGVDGPHETASR